MLNKISTRAVLVYTGLVCLALIGPVPHAQGDELGYLINVTMRPGYHFANADEALMYGHSICDSVVHNRSYADIVADVTTELGISDSFQVTYLIGQAVDELCPAQIWQLRNSAGRYQPANDG
ncbi:MAG: DUF732 domain-containing protein [Mycolicibacterium fortuitum]|nr:DUF732 domain-containing protein [Mycolicibacterium fortuitum]WAY19738.1 DUF732 domain-containing protein [Mycolicibacterium fortuitum]